MSDTTPFKTPLPYRTRKYEQEDLETPSKSSSDSDASISSGESSPQVSIVAEFDDLMRSYHSLKEDYFHVNSSYLNFVESFKELLERYEETTNECKRLHGELNMKTAECSDLESKLGKARKLFDQEKHTTRQMKKERDEVVMQINLVRDLLFKDKVNTNRLTDDVRHKLSFLQDNYSQDPWDYNRNGAQLSAIKEVNSTGSMLSEFSYSRSEDDLDCSDLQAGKPWRKSRPSRDPENEPAIKKKRSSEHKVVQISTSETVRATTTVTVPKTGPIVASSVIESVPQPTDARESTTKFEAAPSAPPAHLVLESWNRESPQKPSRNINTRQHCFQQKTIVMPGTCGPCEKRIRFGKTALKCKECKTICHVECKDILPLPCVPAMCTPNRRNILGVIGDYSPTTPPMVPAILIHCINEIELRGFNEVGIYRVPGAELDVKMLKEKLLKGKCTPCLNNVDINVICGTVKDFLRSLHEPLVTYRLRKEFVQAVTTQEPIDVVPLLCQIISKLPQPNRDTLAYMVLHLQRVAQSPQCKMNIINLAKVFGPTIVGYSSDDPDPGNLLNEVVEHNAVMEQLLNISAEYWSPFVDVDSNLQSSKLQQTPSTDSLLRLTTGKRMFTPNRLDISKKQKYFASPQL